jgi:hypothetical protein
MLPVNRILGWGVNLVLAGGLVWAAVVWRSRHRAAVLVAVACALQLAYRLLWAPGTNLLFGPLRPSSSAVQRFFLHASNNIYVLVSGVTLALLIYAALGSADRKP